MSFCSLRKILPLRQAITRKFSTSSRNYGHKWYYRTPPDRASKRVIVVAEAAGGVTWWWILWHLYSQPEHILGEYPYPDAKAWTNAELGIPPDDED